MKHTILHFSQSGLREEKTAETEKMNWQSMMNFVLHWLQISVIFCPPYDLVTVVVHIYTLSTDINKIILL